MKVLIVGGGIAGCTCAALMKKYGIAEVTLIERASEFGNIGYLIALWGNGRRILKELGIDEEVAVKNGCEYDTDTFMDSNGRLLKKVSLAVFKRFFATVVIKRTDLHRGLFELLEGIPFRYKTTVTRLVENDRAVRVEFSDGSVGEYDLVVGADGIHSSIREQVFGNSFLRPYGWGVWMYWMPESATPLPSEVVAFYGNARWCGILPFYTTSVATIIAKVPFGTGHPLERRRTALVDLFSDFCEPARAIIAAAPAPEQIYYDELATVEMPRWYKGRVVLMGDAHHAISPVTGMGASMAIEDAWVLVDELRRGGTLASILSRYADRREKRIRAFRKIVERLDRWTMAEGVSAALRNIALPYMPVGYFLNPVKDFVGAEI